MASCIDVTERVLEAAEYGVDLTADRRLEIIKDGKTFYVFHLKKEVMINDILRDLREGQKGNS